MGDTEIRVREEGPRSLIPRLLSAGRASPERVVLRFGDGNRWPCAVTHGQLPGRISFARRALEASGLRAGDRVTLALEVGPEAVFAFLGAVSAGAIPAFAPPWGGGFGGGGEWLDRLVDDARRIHSKLVLLPAGLGHVATEKGLRTMAGEAVVGIDAEPLEPKRKQGDDLCLLQWTSGSTGRPRAVRVTHGNVLANADAVHARIEARSDDVMVSWAPLHHDMGLQGGLLHVPLAGGEACLMPPRSFLRRPSSWLEALSDRKATLTLGPSFSYALTRRAMESVPPDNLSLKRVRMIFNGAEPIDADAVRHFLEGTSPYGLDPGSMTPAFGLGEATLAVTMTVPGEGMRLTRRPGLAPVVSCGTALPGVRVKIHDQNGRALTNGESGEIVVGGDSVCPGYDSEEDPEVFRNGWVHTGDLGFLEEGRLHVIGRKKDILIVRGVKVAPSDVERAAERERAVVPGRALAFSVPDPREGTEKVVLLVRVRAPAEDRASVARRIVARVLEETGLGVDLRFVHSSQISRTTSGKLRRAEARARFLGEGAG
jgi:acyl-CoA synthetase (AMP-forming)/AMP-acid ligase II